MKSTQLSKEKKKNPPACRYTKCETVSEFKKLAIELIKQDLKNTRYKMKYIPAKNCLEVSCTNNKKLFKFSTSSEKDVAKLNDLKTSVLKFQIQMVHGDRMVHGRKGQHQKGGGGKKKGKRRKRKKKR